jgi:hypothetical protein
MSNPRYQPNRRSFFSKGSPKPKKKKSFPDLNKDGKITKADILKGRGVFGSGSKPLRPKPQDRYGQVMKPKPIKGKK